MGQRARIISMLVVALAYSCASPREEISARDPGIFDKNVRYEMQGRPIGPAPGPEIYVRQKSIRVEKKEQKNTTGSLFSADDERNFLFTGGGPISVGRYLDVAIKSNRIKVGADPEQKEDEKEESDDELLSALPHLEPADKAAQSVVRKLRVKIVHRYDNGDALVMATRRSQRESFGNEISVQARIPYARLVAGDQLTSADLAEVHFVESTDGELIERRSTGWEDEYTLRLSGFNESKSKLAMELDDKRKQIEQVRERLANRIRSFGNERNQLAKDREQNRKNAEKQQEEVEKLQKEVSEKEETIAERDAKIKEQEEQIKELTPDEKQGDEKEGSSGED